MIQRVLKTDLLYTSAGKPLQSGMLAIDEHNRIAAVGVDLKVAGIEVEYFQGFLCPGFVNTHCHLELSHLLRKVNQKTELNGFIRELQTVRSANDAEVQMAIEKADQEMVQHGIVAVGDISNGSATLNTKKNSSIFYHTFVELFGFDSKQAGSILERGEQLRGEYIKQQLPTSIIPHSPYSVSKELFSLIAEQGRNTPLSIHNQETKAENEMYLKGEGKMIQMLQSFGLDTSNFEVSGKTSLISYLGGMPLETPLLLVHNTFTSKEDIEIAQSIHSDLYWCFCPKANLYIENRLPDLPSFLEAGVKCTLGTDSLASNNILSIWDEIQVIRKHYPSIPLETLIEWGTINGAQFLGVDRDYGSFEVGKKAKVNWISDLTVQPIC